MLGTSWCEIKVEKSGGRGETTTVQGRKVMVTKGGDTAVKTGYTMLHLNNLAFGHGITIGDYKVVDVHLRIENTDSGRPLHMTYTLKNTTEGTDAKATAIHFYYTKNSGNSVQDDCKLGDVVTDVLKRRSDTIVTDCLTSGACIITADPHVRFGERAKDEEAQAKKRQAAEENERKKNIEATMSKDRDRSDRQQDTFIKKQMEAASLSSSSSASGEAVETTALPAERSKISFKFGAPSEKSPLSAHFSSGRAVVSSHGRSPSGSGKHSSDSATKSAPATTPTLTPTNTKS